MKKIILFVSLCGIIVLFNACQKEYSYEIGGISTGSLLEDGSGECLPKSIQGIYEVGTELSTGEHYIDVEVEVASTGAYRVYSDTANGIYFEGKGVFAATGRSTVRLAGYGIPLNAGIHHIIISYDNTECRVQVNVLPNGAADPADFILAGGPSTCLDFDLKGSYIRGVAVSENNRVDIKVNVTKIGTYNISTTSVNGISFTGTGVFTTTGDQIITLSAQGTPEDIVATEIQITAGSSQCSIPIAIVAGAEFTINCQSAVVIGDYEEGVALNANNSIEVEVDVTTVGPYSISGSVNGMSFSTSGNFSSTGNSTITLTGSGTPAADGSFELNLPGSSPCPVGINVEPGAVAADLQWKFTSGSTNYSGPTDEAVLTSAGSVNTLVLSGSAVSGFGTWNVVLTNTGGEISTGTYSGTATSGRFAAFTFSDGLTNWMSFPGTGTSLNVVVTTYNTTEKVIEGTFSGSTKDAISGAAATIAGGTFKVKLP